MQAGISLDLASGHPPVLIHSQVSFWAGTSTTRLQVSLCNLTQTSCYSCRQIQVSNSQETQLVAAPSALMTNPQLDTALAFSLCACSHVQATFPLLPSHTVRATQPFCMDDLSAAGMASIRCPRYAPP